MFKNSYQAWVRQAIFGSALLLVVASCGSAENDDTAYEASGGQSFPVTVTCDSGSSVTVDVPSDDEGQIDDHLNSIDPCENDGGYASVNFTGCQNSDPRTVTIDANNGAIPDFHTLDYCENDTAAPATTSAPDGQSFPVTVTCDSGSSVTVDVPSDDEGQIDDHLNSIDPCENDGGYASVNFTGCQNSDPRTVTIDANNGAIPDFDTLDYCEA